MKFVLTLSLFLVFSAYANENSIVQLQKQMDKMQSFQADFTHVLDTKEGPRRSKGHVLLQKPNQFSWDIQTPEASLILSDGKNLWNYDPILEQVIVQKVGNLSKTSPLFYLVDSNELDKHFEVKAIANQHFALIPKDEEQTFREVTLKCQNDMLSEITFIDLLGQKSVFSFSNQVLNKKIADKHFLFEVQDGVDVIYSSEP